MNKKIIPAAVMAAALLAGAADMVQSGGYHAGNTLVCSECHSMHYSVNNAEPPMGSGGVPHDYLLLRATQVDLCLACHDADGGGTTPNLAPDVMTGASGQQATYRSAGAFMAAAGVTSAYSHDLAVSGNTAPGSSPVYTTPAAGMLCSTCHDVHGNAYYRNLDPTPANRAVTPVYLQTGGTDVLENVTTPTSTQYSVANIEYRTDKMTRWCATCHNNFYATTYPPTWPDGNIGGGATGDTSAANDQWKRHPGSHITLGQANTNTNADSAYFLAETSKEPTIDPSNDSPGIVTDDIPFCGSCHKAHGSPQSKPKHLIYDDRTTAALEDGTSYNQLCQSCHNQ